LVLFPWGIVGGGGGGSKERASVHAFPKFHQDLIRRVDAN
jgi:hypothetical protein